MFPSASPPPSPRGTLRVSGKQNLLFPVGPVNKCFVIPPDSKIEKNLENNDLVDAFAYGGCFRRTSGSQNRAVVPKPHDNSLSSQLTKNKDSTEVFLFCFF